LQAQVRVVINKPSHFVSMNDDLRLNNVSSWGIDHEISSSIAFDPQ